MIITVMRNVYVLIFLYRKSLILIPFFFPWIPFAAADDYGRSLAFPFSLPYLRATSASKFFVNSWLLLNAVVSLLKK